MAERLLMIEDDAALAQLVRDDLAPLGFDVVSVGTAADGLRRAGDETFDAVLLDVMLPDLDGFEVCRRRSSSDVPVLMLTARGDDEDRIAGLEIGADDYLPKPFNPRELLARIRAVLRRRRPTAGRSAPLRFGRLEIDGDARVVRVDGDGVLVIFALLVSVVWVVHPAETWERGLMDALGTTTAELLPGPDEPLAELRGRVDRLAARLDVDISVFDAAGERLASSGPELPPPGPRSSRRDWIRHRGRDVSVPLDLPDGRVLVARRRHPAGQGALAFLVSLSLLALAVALGAWPLVRRLTRRLERLRRGVEELGCGDLKTRAPVEGLEAGEGVERKESVDLLALLAEEAARTCADLEGEVVVTQGDPRLPRRLVRNLLENARRHGGAGRSRGRAGEDLRAVPPPPREPRDRPGLRAGAGPRSADCPRPRGRGVLPPARRWGDVFRGGPGGDATRARERRA